MNRMDIWHTSLFDGAPIKLSKKKEKLCCALFQSYRGGSHWFFPNLSVSSKAGLNLSYDCAEKG